MAEGQEPQAPPPDRSRRAVILATVGIVVIMGLAVFYVAVVAPLRETHEVVREYTYASRKNSSLLTRPFIERLGGSERAVPRLRTYLQLPARVAPHRWEAAYLLGDCGEPAIPALRSLAVRDANRDVRLRAINALGQIGPRAGDAVPALMFLLDERDEDICATAANALIAIKPPPEMIVPAFIRLLRDTSRTTVLRACAAQALERLEKEAADAVPALLEALGDDDAWVRHYSALALSKIKPDALGVVSVLVEALHSSDRLRRERAAGALARLGALAGEAIGAQSPGRIGSAVQAAIPALEKALRDPSFKVRYRSAIALCRITGDSQRGLPLLFREFKEGNRYRRLFMVRELSEIEPVALEATPVIQEALNDKDERVRRAAAAALKKIRGEEPAPDD